MIAQHVNKKYLMREKKANREAGRWRKKKTRKTRKRGKMSTKTVKHFQGEDTDNKE